MKGKKVNYKFVTDFINTCTSENIVSSENIISTAKNKILDIERKIKEIENLKVLRNNLLDVLFVLGYTDKTNDKKKLPYYSINKILAKKICNLVINDSYDISNLEEIEDKENFLFTLKQLIKYNILNKNNMLISKGELYFNFIENYLKI